jgi:NAD(P)-dependent dehydrogenase (short-subunit alcohol dehydrogenase family)
MDLGLKGRRALVCASSQGLGYACAFALAREGAEIMVNGRDAAKLEATRARIAGETGATVHAIVADLGAIEGRAHLVAQAGAVGQRLSDLVVLPSEKGISDGLIVDTDDTIWLALWEGSAVHRYSPNGELLEELRAPISKLTCPALVGPDLDILVVTSAWQDLTAQQRESEPWAGHVITTPVNASGRLPFRFGGHQV